MPLYALNDLQPEVDSTAFVAPSADLTGRVTVGAQASVWFGVAARGDVEPIVIGPRCNVQDGACLHTDAGYPCILSEDVTVGHRAIVHGAYCDQGSLVGMGAIMLTGSRLGKGAVLAAGALLREGQEVPDGMLAVGVPAKVVRAIEPFENAAHYVENGQRYRQEMREVTNK